ncbi:type II secretion system F family protein [Cellulomonas alba]|uniref:Type II secretion system F family protein n=1 Tax=Cellulomonas alba TaxID=3053467 RepID=A0ABT7SE51_9CELL|nr:type II secretion system F family protein [Cellulomonas alba]MDM7854467.1 type II secretion system F family protein [Cellulomonas alba]
MRLLLVAAAVGAVVPWTGRRGRGGRRRDPVTEPVAETDVVLVLDLLDVAVASGVALPRALTVVGAAIGGRHGRALAAAGGALLVGASWRTAWAGAPAELAAVAETLAPSWTAGAAPGPALRACAEQRRRGRRAQLRSAAGALGVRLVLPLGLCFLPAFLLVGLVPMMVGLARGLFG